MPAFIFIICLTTVILILIPDMLIGTIIFMVAIIIGICFIFSRHFFVDNHSQKTNKHSETKFFNDLINISVLFRKNK